jgi:hypothetical protein
VVRSYSDTAVQLVMDLELVKILLDGGFSAVIVFMLLDMRREAREQREQTWELLRYLIEREKASGLLG